MGEAGKTENPSPGLPNPDCVPTQENAYHRTCTTQINPSKAHTFVLIFTVMPTQLCLPRLTIHPAALLSNDTIPQAPTNTHSISPSQPICKEQIIMAFIFPFALEPLFATGAFLPGPSTHEYIAIQLCIHTMRTDPHYQNLLS